MPPKLAKAKPNPKNTHRRSRGLRQARHRPRAIRKFFDSGTNLEVETPMLHTIAGGAARPPSRHTQRARYPALAPHRTPSSSSSGWLSVASIVCMRSTALPQRGHQHPPQPDFTMLEFYQAYANYHDLMQLTEELVTFVATEVNGTTITTSQQRNRPRKWDEAIDARSHHQMVAPTSAAINDENNLPGFEKRSNCFIEVAVPFINRSLRRAL